MFDTIATLTFVLLGVLLTIDAIQRWKHTKRPIFAIAAIVSILTALTFLWNWNAGFLGLLVTLLIRLLARLMQKQSASG
jgi:predicted branched-subunit amino acid permease